MTLPSSWTWTTIQEVTEPIQKVNPGENPDSEFDYIDISSIDNTVQRIISPKQYKGSNAPSRARQLIKTNDVLFSTVRTYLKNIALVPTYYDGQIASTGFSVLRAKAVTTGKFLYYYCQTEAFLNPLNELQRGTSYPAVRDSDVREQPIPLPLLPEQERIVARIESLFTQLDAGVTELKRVQAALKRYRSSVLNAAVMGTLSDLRAELNKLGENRLPEGWTWTNFGDLVENSLIGLDRGKSQQSKESIPGRFGYIKMNYIYEGKVDLFGLVFVPASESEVKKYCIEDGDVLFNTRNSLELVGKTGIVKLPKPNTLFNNNLMRIRTKSNVLSDFLCFQMCSEIFQKKLDTVKRSTTNIAAIYAKDLFHLPIALPPLSEQHRIVAEVEQCLSVAQEVKAAVQTNLSRASRLRQAILKRAFEGKLVEQNPHDELAAELQEHMRAENASIQNINPSTEIEIKNARQLELFE